MRHWEQFARRGGLWLAGIFFLVAQFHVCVSQFVLPDGEVCRECPELSDHRPLPKHPVLSAEKHGDCHDCCTVQACDDHSSKSPTAVHSPNLEWFGLVATKELVALPELTIIRATAPKLTGCPTTGPPLSASPRAPPASSLSA